MGLTYKDGVKNSNNCFDIHTDLPNHINSPIKFVVFLNVLIYIVMKFMS